MTDDSPAAGAELRGSCGSCDCGRPCACGCPSCGCVPTTTAAKRINRDGTRFHWWLWRQVIKLPTICNANAHSRIIGRYRDQSLKVDDVCRSDLARNGTCWCGKLGTLASSPPTSGEGK